MVRQCKQIEVEEAKIKACILSFNNFEGLKVIHIEGSKVTLECTEDNSHPTITVDVNQLKDPELCCTICRDFM